MGRASHAIALLQHTALARHQVPGAGHPDLLEIHTLLAEACWSLGKTTAAIRLLEDAADATADGDQMRGTDFWRTSWSIDGLAACYRVAGRVEDAIRLLEQGELHGYAVLEALRSGSDGTFDLPTGTIYPALHRLQRAGLVDSRWDKVAGRRRRTYRLTPAGAEALEAERATWNKFSTAVTAVLGRQTWAAATP